VKANKKIDKYFDKAIRYLSDDEFNLKTSNEGNYRKTQEQTIIVALMFQLDEYFHDDERL